MKLNYPLYDYDFLNYQLYVASKSDRINKNLKKNWLILTVGFFLAALYFYSENHIPMVLYFGFVSILFGAFYPYYFRWKHKRHYKKHISENYKNRFGHNQLIDVGTDEIFCKDFSSEGKINISAIVGVDETTEYFFLNLTTGMSLIIPKDRLNNTDDLRNELIKRGLSVFNYSVGKWK